MEDLARWLGEQLDEDERIARAATERQPYDEWDAVGDDREGDVARKHWSVVKIARMEQIPAARDLAVHIASHDPVRVLREIDAKRHLLKALLSEGHAALRPGGSTEIYCGADYEAGDPCDCGRDERVASYLRLLAAVYQDRPGYKESWRP